MLFCVKLDVYYRIKSNKRLSFIMDYLEILKVVMSVGLLLKRESKREWYAENFFIFLWVFFSYDKKVNVIESWQYLIRSHRSRNGSFAQKTKVESHEVYGVTGGFNLHCSYWWVRSLKTYTNSH